VRAGGANGSGYDQGDGAESGSGSIRRTTASPTGTCAPRQKRRRCLVPRLQDAIPLPTLKPARSPRRLASTPGGGQDAPSNRSAYGRDNANLRPRLLPAEPGLPRLRRGRSCTRPRPAAEGRAPDGPPRMSPPTRRVRLTGYMTAPIAPSNPTPLSSSTSAVYLIGAGNGL
jgi:hypothetical protein